jgi:hypothetical protein
MNDHTRSGGAAISIDSSTRMGAVSIHSGGWTGCRGTTPASAIDAWSASSTRPGEALRGAPVVPDPSIRVDAPGGGVGSADTTNVGVSMVHVTTMRRLFERINAGDVDGIGTLLADDFVEHEELPGLAPTKEGVMDFFRM